MYIFCSKALADALNIKKNELQKMPADAQIDELYAWHGLITKLNGKSTIKRLKFKSGFFPVPLVFLDIILVPNISHQPLFYYILSNYRFSLEIPSIR